jgi:hypothetical protein
VEPAGEPLGWEGEPEERVATRVESGLQEQPIGQRSDTRMPASSASPAVRPMKVGDESEVTNRRERRGGSPSVKKVRGRSPAWRRRKSATEVTTAAMTFGVDVARTNAVREAVSTSHGISRRRA